MKSGTYLVLHEFEWREHKLEWSINGGWLFTTGIFKGYAPNNVQNKIREKA